MLKRLVYQRKISIRIDVTHLTYAARGWGECWEHVYAYPKGHWGGGGVGLPLIIHPQFPNSLVYCITSSASPCLSLLIRLMTLMLYCVPVHKFAEGVVINKLHVGDNV